MFWLPCYSYQADEILRTMKLHFSAILKNLKELVDPRKFAITPLELICYFRDIRRFRRKYTGTYPIRVLPILFERTSRNSFDPHYVCQSYWATKRIVREKLPAHHVDIASNVSFVAQLCALFPVIQMEFRPPQIRLSSYNRLSGNIITLPFSDESIQSVTCLHVIEHVGLGRYGDVLDGDGCWKGLLELERIIAPGGSLFLSVPVGRPAVYFNGNYVFKASDIVRALANLKLWEFSYVDDDGNFVEFGSLDDTSTMEYALGLFYFRRPK